MFKKLSSLFVGFCMVFTLAACIGSLPAYASDLYFGVLIRTFSDTYTTTVRTSMAKYMDEAGIMYDIMDANDSQATQNEQLEAFLARGVDCLIVQTVNVAASNGILERANEAGVPVVFFNHEPNDLNRLAIDDTTIFVGTDSPEAGYMQADLFMQFWGPEFDRNGDGIAQVVVFQGSMESQEAFDRSQYCIEGAEDHGYVFDRLSENFVCNWDAALAQEAMTAFLGVHEDAVEVVFCNNDSMAEGVVAALNAIGFNTGNPGDPHILVFGVDATDAGIELIRQGKMQGTVQQDGDAMAKTSIELAQEFVNGKTKAEAVAALGLEIFEGDNASVRISYIPFTIAN